MVPRPAGHAGNPRAVGGFLLRAHAGRAGAAGHCRCAQGQALLRPAFRDRRTASSLLCRRADRPRRPGDRHGLHLRREAAPHGAEGACAPAGATGLARRLPHQAEGGNAPAHGRRRSALARREAPRAGARRGKCRKLAVGYLDGHRLGQRDLLPHARRPAGKADERAEILHAGASGRPQAHHRPATQRACYRQGI